MKEPTSLNDNPLFLLGETGKMLRDQVAATIKSEGYDLTPEQFTILALLYYNDKLNQTEIAETVNRDKTTISRVINRMVEHKLINKKPDPDNLRENIIVLTSKGEIIRNKLIEATGSIYMNTLKDFSDIEISTLHKLLEKLNTNLHNY